MAVVLALVRFSILAVISFFLGVVLADLSLASAFAGALVIALAAAVLGGALRIARDADRGPVRIGSQR